MAKQRQRDSKRQAFWRGVMKRFESSGLTVRAFCARQKLSEPSFYHWRRLLRQRDVERAAPGARAARAAPAFVPVVVSADLDVAARDGAARDVAARDVAAEDGAAVAIEVRGPGGGRSCIVRLPAALPMRRVAELVHAITAAPAAGAAIPEVRS